MTVNASAAFAFYHRAMNRVSHLADRASLVSLKLLTALNVLAFLGALCVMFLAVARVDAAEAALPSTYFHVPVKPDRVSRVDLRARLHFSRRTTWPTPSIWILTIRA